MLWGVKYAGRVRVIRISFLRERYVVRLRYKSWMSSGIAQKHSCFNQSSLCQLDNMLDASRLKQIDFANEKALMGKPHGGI